MSVIDKPCPACHAEPGQRCKTTQGRTTDYHNARYTQSVSPRNKMRPKKAT